MVTNNDFPVKIEANDRRNVACRCKAVHRDDVEYFTSLSNEIQVIGTKELYLSQKAKKDIIRSLRSQLDDSVTLLFHITTDDYDDFFELTKDKDGRDDVGEENDDYM
ncbi:MAG: hypothetical protein EZS28_012399 [Streblomastix strix]|uniref:Uncharacterized protein n=1 Tax=Streblomastix strix TaxID=222440 RepID=A0A5J4WAS6_9EUKA|nr:MAG: hypothetical protein EZS28_012399 [Streblomastix strix]